MQLSMQRQLSKKAQPAQLATKKGTARICGIGNQINMPKMLKKRWQIDTSTERPRLDARVRTGLHRYLYIRAICGGADCLCASTLSLRAMTSAFTSKVYKISAHCTLSELLDSQP